MHKSSVCNCFSSADILEFWCIFCGFRCVKLTWSSRSFAQMIDQPLLITWLPEDVHMETEWLDVFFEEQLVSPPSHLPAINNYAIVDLIWSLKHHVGLIDALKSKSGLFCVCVGTEIWNFQREKRPGREVKAPWCKAMGCGGSRTDALEPRYLESWTKETESTWLTSTDELPLSSIQSIPSEADFTTEKSASPGRKDL